MTSSCYRYRVNRMHICSIFLTNVTFLSCLKGYILLCHTASFPVVQPAILLPLQLALLLHPNSPRLLTWPTRTRRRFTRHADAGRVPRCVYCGTDWRSARWPSRSCPVTPTPSGPSSEDRNKWSLPNRPTLLNDWLSQLVWKYLWDIPCSFQSKFFFLYAL